MSTVESLPYVDEHATEIGAPTGATWEALLAVVERSFSTPAKTRAAHLLGCADTEPLGPRPLATGSSFPGFHVEAAQPPRELVLRGNHRLSDYALIFRLDGLGPNRSRLRAEARAAFPGLHGSAYRALTVGTRGHALAMRHLLLRAVRRQAERS